MKDFEFSSDKKEGRSTASNGRFGASGAVARPKVCAELEVSFPSKRQWKPRLRQAAGTLEAMRGRQSGGERLKANSGNDYREVVIKK